MPSFDLRGETVLATSTYLIVFRIVHIVAAIAWGGAIFLLVVFLQPTAKAVGPAAGPFMRELLGTRRLADVILRIAGTTIVAGAFLYWHDWQQAGSLGHFVEGRFGLALTIGSVSAIVAFLVGLLGTRPTMQRMLALSGQLAAAGDAPPPGLPQELQRVQARARTLAKTNLAFVALAAVAMATARYW
jgi:uncharacterized membrane protein